MEYARAMKMRTIAAIGEVMIELSSVKPTDSSCENTNAQSLMKLSFGGDTFNTSVYLARFGIEVDYITCLGDDEYSKQILSFLSAEKIGCGLIESVSNATTGLYSITNSADGEREFTYWRNQSPARELFSQNIHTSQLFKQLMSFDYIYLSGISLAIISSQAKVELFEFIDRYRHQGGVVVFDSNYRARLWNNLEEAQDVIAQMFTKTDIALLTFEDEQALWGWGSPQQSIDFCKQSNIGEVVIKQGADKVVLQTDGQLSSVDVPKVDNIIDTTGAGDSFNAGYLAARMQDKGAIEAIHYGINCAANVIQYSGAITPKSDGFESIVNS